MTITFPVGTNVSQVSFKSVEVDGDWGSAGAVFLDPPAIPYDNDSAWALAVAGFHTWSTPTGLNIFVVPINRRVTNIVLAVQDITYQSEIFIDDLQILGMPNLSIITTNVSLGFSNGLFGFNVSGLASQTNVIEGSTNLLDWVPLQTNVMGVSPVYFSDSQWTNYPGRFYRLRSP